jgi:hypothetical protein
LSGNYLARNVVTLCFIAIFQASGLGRAATTTGVLYQKPDGKQKINNILSIIDFYLFIGAA